MTKTCGRVWDGGVACQMPRGPHGPCSFCWRLIGNDEKAVLMSVESGELPEPESTCLVPACRIPATNAETIPVEDGRIICIGHWRRLPVVLRHGVLNRNEGAVDQALAAIAESEDAWLRRFPARTTGSAETRGVDVV